MNKKGFIGIGTAIAVLILIIGVGFVLSFLFSSTLRYVLIGIALFGGGIWLVSTLKDDRAKLTFGILLFGGGIILLIFAGTRVTQNVLGVSSFDADIIGFGDKVVITVTPNSENVILQLSEDQLNSKIEGEGFQVNEGIRLSLKTEEFKRVYPLLREQDEQYLKLKVTDSGNYIDWKNFLVYQIYYSFTSPEREKLNMECRKRGYSETVVGYMRPEAFAIDNLMCIERSEIVGSRAKTSGSAYDEFKIEANANGETETITRNNQNPTLKNGAIEIEFIGQLESPEKVQGLPFDVLWDDGEFKNLITDNSMTRQNGYYDYFKDCISSTYVDDDSKHLTCIKNYNNGIDNLLKNRNNDFAPELVSNINLITENSNKGRLEVDLEAPPIPVFRIVIDGDFLGIEELSGKPEITSCIDNIVTESGNDEELRGKITIKNKGNQQGTFYISRECSNSNIDVLLPSKIVLEKGISKTLDAVITGASSQKGVIQSGTCKITVEDKASGEKDDCRFSVSIEFADVICTPGKNFCSNDKSKVLGCNSQGTDSSIIETCKEGEKCGVDDSGEITCIKQSILDKLTGGDDGTVEIPDSEDGGEESLECKWYEEEVIETEIDNGFLAWRKWIPFVEPKEIKVRRCRTQDWVYWVGLGVIIFILGLILVFIWIPRKKVKFKSSGSYKKKRRLR